MIVYTLAITMVVLFIISFYTNNQEIASPPVAFFAPFSLAAIDLIYNVDKWRVELKNNTYLIMLVGSLCFLGAVYFARAGKVFLRSGRFEQNRFKSTIEPEELNYIKVGRINCWIFAALQVITFVLCLIAVMRISRRFGISGSLSILISGYKNLKSFTTENISLGRLNNNLYDFCYASGFIWFYIVANNFAVSKKVDKLPLLNLILSIAISLEKGSRVGAVTLLVAGVAMMVIIWQKKSKRRRLKFRQILLVILIAVIVVGTFQKVGELLGRVSAADFGGYLSTYLSAPIRNLDYYINNVMGRSFSRPDVWGKMTFVRMINFLGGFLKIDSWVYELDLPFLRSNGYVCGNVYTTFYAYLYDFGVTGVIVLMILMGLISQVLYQKATKPSKRNRRYSINLWIIVYSYVFYSLAFSFFSNKFYEGIVSIQFIKYLVFWAMVRYFVERTKFKAVSFKRI